MYVVIYINTYIYIYIIKFPTCAQDIVRLTGTRWHRTDVNPPQLCFFGFFFGSSGAQRCSDGGDLAALREVPNSQRLALLLARPATAPRGRHTVQAAGSRSGAGERNDAWSFWEQHHSFKEYPKRMRVLPLFNGLLVVDGRTCNLFGLCWVGGKNACTWRHACSILIYL